MCTPCVVENNKIGRPVNQPRYNEITRIKRTARKIRAVAYKGGKCTNCGGVFHHSAFDFHHVDPATKAKDPGLMMTHSDEDLFRELDKCILLCANCHRIYHYESY